MGVQADGERFASWQNADGTVQAIRDDLTATQHNTPAGCRAGAFQVGYAVASCAEQPGVLDLATNVFTRVPGLDDVDGLGDVGAQWVTANHALTLLWINWRTGEQRTQPFDRILVYDLDAPAFGIPKPLLSGTTVLGRDDGRIVTTEQLPRLSLRTNGQTRTIRAKCLKSFGCSGVQYGHGVLSWVEANNACAYVVSTSLTGCWKPSAALRARDSLRYQVGATHTAAALYVRVGHPGQPGTGPSTLAAYRVSLAPLQ